MVTSFLNDYPTINGWFQATLDWEGEGILTGLMCSYHGLRVLILPIGTVDSARSELSRSQIK